MFILTDSLQGMRVRLTASISQVPLEKRQLSFTINFVVEEVFKPCSQLGDFEVSQGNSEDESLISCDVLTSLI